MLDSPLLQFFLGVLAVLAAFAYVWVERARRRRDKWLADLNSSLLRYAGPQLSVVCSKWKLGPRSFRRPRRIDLVYDPSSPSHDPKWISSLVSMVSERAGFPYKSVNHEGAFHRVSFVYDPVEAEEEDCSEKAQLERRTKAMATEILGKGSSSSCEWNGETLVAVDVDLEDEQAIRLTPKVRQQYVVQIVTAMLPGRWRGKWDLQKLKVRFELRPEIPSVILHPIVEVTEANRWQIPTGQTEDGETTFWELKSTEPHGLVTGKTGTGKTVHIQGIVVEWTRRGWPAWISDPKQIEFLGMKEWPNVENVAVTVEHQMASVMEAWNLMEKRYQIITSGGDERDFTPLLLVLDEYVDFKSAVDSWWSENKHKGAPSKCPVYGAVGSIARKGRSAKIHLLFGTQRPDAEFMTGEMRDNLAFRHSLGRLSSEGAKMMWGSVYHGTTVPKKIPGRGTTLDAEGRPAEAQSYWTPDPRRAIRDKKTADLKLLLDLCPEVAEHKRFEWEIPDEGSSEWIGDDGKSTYTPWGAICEASKRYVYQEDGELKKQLEEAYRSSLEKDSAEREERRPALQLVKPEADADELEEYEEIDRLEADRLKTGDRVNLDGQWVVVESAAIDCEEPSLISVAWRDDLGESGYVQLDKDMVLEVHRISD
ncbi:helicase HerA-like domain-containing protein [Dermabacteraceae bacterium CCM 9520]